MDKKHIAQALKVIKETSPKRNFKQSIELIVNLQAIDLKKQDNKVDVYAQLHFERGKKTKICGLVGPELLDQAKQHFDTAIPETDFSKYDKKAIKKLAKEHQFFVAQATIMPKVAAAFGKVLGPRAKMPNPKAGCVVPPNANLQAVAEKLQKTVRVKVDTNPLYQVFVATDDLDEEKTIDNILTIYNALIHALPNEKNNIKNAYLKLTMGKAQLIGGEEETQSQEEQKKPKKAEVKEEKPAEEPTADTNQPVAEETN